MTEIQIISALKHWEKGEFVPIVDSEKVCYGGHQQWLTAKGVSQFFADRACGVTAATNVLSYFGALKSNDFESFNALQLRLYHELTPALWGIPSITTLSRRLETASIKIGIPLKAVAGPVGWSKDNVLNYVVAGLNRNSPVLIVSWDSQIRGLKLHWSTITCVYEDPKGIKMVVSNWGEQKTYDFDFWVTEMSHYKGVVYFEAK